MKLRSAARLLALALVGLITLSGCVASNDAAKKNLIELELAQLAATLHSLPYVGFVEAKYDDTIQPDQPVRVNVVANGATKEQALVIVVTVNATLSRELFSTVSRSFELQLGSGMHLQSAFGLTLNELVNEFGYVAEVQESLGGAQLNVSIGDTAEGSGGYSRDIDAGRSNLYAEDWERLRAIPDPNSSPERTWYFRGLSVNGSLPPAEITDALYRSTQILPPSNSDQGFGSGSNWTSADQRLDVVVNALDSGNQTHEFSTQPQWPEVSRAVASLTGSGISHASLSFTTYSDDRQRTGIVHFGTCAKLAPSLKRDQELVDALTGYGVELSDSSGPGYCEKF